MILPSRHGRGANGRRIGGPSGRVAIVRSAAAAASCVLADGQARVCAMDLRALEEWGKGKGEKGGGEDLVKDEQLLPYRAATTLARGGHRRLTRSNDHVGDSSSS